MDCRELQPIEGYFKFNLTVRQGEKDAFQSGEFQLGTKIRWKLEVIGDGPKVIILLNQETAYYFTCQYTIRLIDNGTKKETFGMGIKDISGSVWDGGQLLGISIDFPASNFIEPTGFIPSNLHVGKNYYIHTLHCHLKVYNFYTACPKPFTKITTDFENMLEGGQFSDLTIVTDANQKIAVHKNVLETRSSVFRAMLECPMTESSTGEILIKDFSEEVIKDMLIYMYSGKTKFENVEKSMQLLKISDKYDLPDLRESCCRFLANNLEISTCLEVLKTASKLCIKSLQDVTSDFISDNLDQISQAEIRMLDFDLVISVMYNSV